jgi:hypothetical protein
MFIRFRNIMVTDSLEGKDNIITDVEQHQEK